jgi:hypothetical protein
MREVPPPRKPGVWSARHRESLAEAMLPFLPLALAVLCIGLCSLAVFAGLSVAGWWFS